MLTGLQLVKTVIDGDTYFFEAREGQRGTQFGMSLHNRLYLDRDIP